MSDKTAVIMCDNQDTKSDLTQVVQLGNDIYTPFRDYCTDIVSEARKTIWVNPTKIRESRKINSQNSTIISILYNPTDTTERISNTKTWRGLEEDQLILVWSLEGSNVIIACIQLGNKCLVLQRQKGMYWDVLLHTYWCDIQKRNDFEDTRHVLPENCTPEDVIEYLAIAVDLIK
jgi:hypothetical protein